MCCRKWLRELLEDCRIADAVYEDTPEQFAEKTMLNRDNILQFEHEADHFRTAYSIALVPDRKEVRAVCCQPVWHQTGSERDPHGLYASEICALLEHFGTVSMAWYHAG
jgi:hypothetical protein